MKGTLKLPMSDRNLNNFYWWHRRDNVPGNIGPNDPALPYKEMVDTSKFPTCPNCKGEGFITSDGMVCPDCDGFGYLEDGSDYDPWKLDNPT